MIGFLNYLKLYYKLMLMIKYEYHFFYVYIFSLVFSSLKLVYRGFLEYVVDARGSWFIVY